MIARVVLASCAVILAAAVFFAAGDPLEQGFRTPPLEARPSVYFLLLNGYLNRDWVSKELAEYRRMGVGGLCLFDMGARGDPAACPPAGPQFLSPASAEHLAHVIRTAGSLGMKVELSVTSSWDMGASWVTPEDASKALVETRIEVEGPRDIDLPLPMPEIPKAARLPDGRPMFYRDVAVVGIRDAERLPGYEFLFQLDKPLPQTINKVVFYNSDTSGTGRYAAREFRIWISNADTEESSFRELLRGVLRPHREAQEFRFSPVQARYLRLQLWGGEDGRVELSEFEVWSVAEDNVLLSYRGRRIRDGALLLEYSSARAPRGEWAAENIHDGRKEGAAGSWASGPVPPLHTPSLDRVVILSPHFDGERLRWRAPAGRWTVIRYGVTNTGERLKVPSPNSDGLATDHLDPEVTQRYIREVIRRLKPALGDFRGTALRELYLASYEVVGRLWTPKFLDEFRRRRGYDLTPFLPILSGVRIENKRTTDRVLFDFRKTMGELLVDAYYRAAAREAHKAGLGIHAEAGGPGPPIHQVPVDALMANGAIDSVRGEFWPFRPHSPIWVVKETAAAAHIYNKPIVHMEAFTSNEHWSEGPQDLKASADRAFCEGMNHVVWHTSAHQPPEAGKPGWAYGAGTHLMPNVPWWPMARGFLDYLARLSFMLRQGRFVADVLYYYGDGGYNFVPPKHVDPRLGFGFDYDVTNAEVLQRLEVRGRKLVLPHGMEYEILVLPDRVDIHPPVLEKIAALVETGATVIGKKPQRASGYDPTGLRDAAVRSLADRLWGACDGVKLRERSYGRGKIVCHDNLREVLAARGVVPDFQFESPQPDTVLDFIHRRTADAEIYFVRNTRTRPELVSATFRVRDKAPELWDPATGDIRPVEQFEATASGVRLRLALDADGSALVVFRAGGRKPATSKSPAAQRPAPPFEIPGPWTVRFPPGWGAPEEIRLDRLISWTDHPDPGIRYFSGVAEYRTAFELSDAWLKSAPEPQLDLGDLWAAADVELNGTFLGIAWKVPFRLAAGQALRVGPNELRVRVANNWINRLAGDARGGGQRYTRTNITITGSPVWRPWAQVELKPSGLFGPVRLLARDERPAAAPAARGAGNPQAE